MIISVLILIQQPEWANKMNKFASNNYLFGLILIVGLVFLFFNIPKRINKENIKSEISHKSKTNNKDLNVKINNSNKCPKCSSALSKEDRFCGSCGEKIF